MDAKIAIIGLGYVGLPLARLFATKFPVVGFDIDEKRISEVNDGKDETHEVSKDLLNSVLVKENPQVGNSKNGLFCTSKLDEISQSNFFIITVPTPVDEDLNPDFAPLISASNLVAKFLKKDDIVIYESTVYPGATEEECVPILEKFSGLKFNEDFFVGYSPERINPGDKVHSVEKIMKVTAGSTPEIGKIVDSLYKSVITAGTHLAPTIKIAEASKVIENTQRDINIAFVNELAKIFNLIGIDTQEVLKAAGTKWNFLNFSPGLVGGHCIGVDPYYLAQKAQKFGYTPELILAARRINNSMAAHICASIIKLLLKRQKDLKTTRILVLGFTFKENCADIRNTKVADIVTEFQEFGIHTEVYDPWISGNSVFEKNKIPNVLQIKENEYDVVILAVPHKQFLEINLQNLLKTGGFIFDVKGILPPQPNLFRL